jgi:Fe-S-cluster containining protein
MNETKPSPGKCAVTCPGHCCAALCIPETIDDIRADVHDPDAQMIADMLIPLTHRQAVARAKKFGAPPGTVTRYPSGPKSRWYTCRHWDEETRLCTVWENRPEMCRGYPYDHSCRSGCSYRTPPDELARWVAFERRVEASRSAGAHAVRADP